MSRDEARLVLVRHGQARASVDSVVGGMRGCQGLTDLGRAQAQALTARWAATGELGHVDAVVSSALPRAIETAAVLADGLGVATVEEDRALNELEPGECDGMPWDEAQRRYGGFDVGQQPFRPVSPGGESWAAFGARATLALRDLARRALGTTTVVACHGGIIEQSVVLGFGLPPRTAPAAVVITPANTSVTEWHVAVDGAGPLRWRLARFGDSAHLDREGRPLP
ncbi:MAG TPA: histidine phosphatase family protein [Acidimicrobiales bacterium]|nr:histidine phosphatase family protein [Acidimicrobiales bacterium]